MRVLGVENVGVENVIKDRVTFSNSIKSLKRQIDPFVQSLIANLL